MALEFLSPWSVLSTVSAILVVTFISLLRWRFGYWRRRGVPHMEATFPFGNCGDVFMGKKSFADLSVEIYKRFEGKPYCGAFMAFQPTLFVMDPELIKDVTIRFSLSHFANHISQPDADRDPLLANNLFMLKGQRWKDLRGLLNPAFSSGKMKLLHSHVLAKAELLSQAICDAVQTSEATLDAKMLLAQFTTDVIASCAFGLDVNSIRNPDNDFFKMGLRLFEQTFRHMLDMTVIFQFPSLVKVLRSVMIVPDVASFFRHLVWNVVGERESKVRRREDYIDYLIDVKRRGEERESTEEKYAHDSGHSHNGNAESITDFDGDDFVAQALSFYLAGYETSSMLAGFTLFELAANPGVQEQLVREIDSALGANGGKVTYDAVQGMRYLEMVVSETLRKYPAFPVLDRVCTEQYHRPDFGLVIPKGLHVMVPVYGFQNDPKYFPDPESFDPERFSEEGKRGRPSHCYMPFGDGPRICIGMRFARLQVNFVIVCLLSKVRVTLPEDLRGFRSCPINPSAFLMSVKGGLPLVFKMRSGSFADEGGTSDLKPRA